jgi:hypothetical protein
MLPMFLSTSRTKALAAMITAATASVVFAGAAPHAHASGCAPVAHTPSVSGGLGFAYADLPCSGAYTIRLVNNAGNTIGAPYSDTGAGGVQTSTTSCAGAIVHTFIYVNVNGVGMSDTSGTVQC